MIELSIQVCSQKCFQREYPFFPQKISFPPTATENLFNLSKAIQRFFSPNNFSQPSEVVNKFKLISLRKAEKSQLLLRKGYTVAMFKFVPSLTLKKPNLTQKGQLEFKVHMK